MSERMGPVREGDRTIGEPCAVCKQAITAGQFITLIALGPGDDPEARERARQGRPYNAIGALAHYACVTGEEE